MISVTEALQIIDRTAVPSKTEATPLIDAFGCILAERVKAPIDMPPFRQSAMDGYAIRFAEGASRFSLVGEMKAGDQKEVTLKPGEAVRVFTGAPVPSTADAVVIQEHVTRIHNAIKTEKIPLADSNIRPQGEQVKIGQKVLDAGTLLNEAAIGFLAGLGFTEIPVHKKPKVAILTTGNELQPPGKPLQPGSIYESNGLMLQMALRRLGIDAVTVNKVKDDLEATKTAVGQAIKNSDLVLISGGISVGDYDFVKEALMANGVDELFYKINQKPGKPLWFGKKEEKIVFALPGNPASSLTCFYVYVLPALRKMMGLAENHLVKKSATLSEAITNPSAKTLFMKATVNENTIKPLTGQASSMLNTYAVANALLIIPEEVSAIAKEEQINYLDLNF